MKYIEKIDKSFKEVTGNKLSNTSLLNLFPIYKSNEKFLNIFRNYILNNDIINDTSYYEIYEVKEKDWLENIAWEYYKSPYLWWVIGIANNIYNPFEELSEGDLIKIIRANYLYQILADIKVIGEI